VIVPWSFQSVAAQVPGDRVLLEGTHVDGVPVHPAAGNGSYVRWANGTIGAVVSIDPATGWIEIESAGQRGWVTRRYVRVVEPAPEPPPEPVSITRGIAAWNLEHFRDTATRGFPENTSGGPSYRPRTDADYARIADIIRTDINADVLILSEINGRPGLTTSVEMDRLITMAGPQWQYRLTAAGNSQRLAIMFNTAAVRLEHCEEIVVSEERIQDADIFARDPLACAFTLLDDSGAPANDLVVIGVHLASGQTLVANHNRAMQVLQERLVELFDGTPFSATERDVIIGGDFNADRYDTKVEDFWTDFDLGGFQFHTLSPDSDNDYAPTRLAGVPLVPRSKIDYLMGSALVGGVKDDLVEPTAEVHTQLLGDGYFDDYREHVSDHVPITVRVRVVSDDD